MFKQIVVLAVVLCIALILTGQTVGVIVGPSYPTYSGDTGGEGVPAVAGYFDGVYFDPTYFDDGS